MAVLVEAISVVVRKDAIREKLRGGWEAFLQAVPNNTMCADEEIVRVGFMSPDEAKEFVTGLKNNGLRFVVDGRALDLAVVDQQRGLTEKCEWLEFCQVPFGDTGGKVAVCWFFNGPRVGAGIHLRGTEFTLVTPAGWQFEGSLSQHFRFVQMGREPDDS